MCRFPLTLMSKNRRLSASHVPHYHALLVMQGTNSELFYAQPRLFLRGLSCFLWQFLSVAPVVQVSQRCARCGTRPHPDPLPRERVERSTVSVFADAFPAGSIARIIEATADVAPSPWGEGRGINCFWFCG